jgi:ribosomal protein S18 acetylase RimI-like enzyme
MTKTGDHAKDSIQSKPYHIRPATEDDYDQIRAINRRAWFGGITTAELLERRHGMLNGTPWIEQITHDVAEHLAQPEVTTFVAEQGDMVIGYAAAQIKREKTSSAVGIVSYNAVDPDFRGQGIGTALTTQVISYLREQKAQVLLVWTLESDESACHIYEHLGFKELTRFVYYSMDCQEQT